MLFLKTMENVFETTRPSLIDEIMDPELYMIFFFFLLMYIWNLLFYKFYT